LSAHACRRLASGSGAAHGADRYVAAEAMGRAVLLGGIRASGRVEMMELTTRNWISGECDALFLFQLETILSKGNGRGNAIEAYYVAGVLQGVSADAQRHDPQNRAVAPRSQPVPSLKRLVGFRE